MGLASRIAKASAAIGGRLKADSRNQEQKYDYISADKILSECGQALAEQGVVVVPAIVADAMEIMDRGNGKSRYDAIVTFHMTVADDEKELVMSWVGRGSDYTVPDKALYKAITSGHKYFLMKLLNIGEGNEDSEHDAADEQPTQQRRQSPPQTPTQQRNGGKPTPPPAAPPADNEDDGVASWAANPSAVLFDTKFQFKNPAEAKGWGMAMGVFNDDKHAENAYNEVKTTVKPKSAADMWQAWINDVARRVNEKEPVPA
jgi:hypothetical protein